MDGGTFDSIDALAVDAAGQVFASGSFENNTLTIGGPGIPTTTVSGLGTGNGYLAAWDASGDLQWVRTAGAQGTDFAQSFHLVANDQGDVFLSGTFSSFRGGQLILSGWGTGQDAIVDGHGDYDVFVAKWNRQGVFQWVRTVGGSDYDDVGSMVLGNNGTLYLTRLFSSNTLTVGGPGLGSVALDAGTSTGLFITSWSDSGALNYVRTLAGEGFLKVNTDYTKDLVVDAQGRAYFSGWFTAPTLMVNGPGFAAPVTVANQGGSDAFLTAWSVSGHLRWLRAVGGAGMDQAAALALDQQGQVYFAGSFTLGNPLVQGPGLAQPIVIQAAGDAEDDVFLIQFNPIGNPVWIRTLTGPGRQSAQDLVVNDRNGVYLAGSFASSYMAVSGPDLPTLLILGEHSVFVAKWNQFGALQWAQTASGSATQRSTGLVLDSGGRPVLVGYSTSIPFTIGGEVVQPINWSHFIWRLRDPKLDLTLTGPATAYFDVETNRIVIQAASSDPVEAQLDLTYSDGPNRLYDFEGRSAQAVVPLYFNQNVVTGRVWSDLNEDGVFDPNEEPLIGARVVADPYLDGAQSSSGSAPITIPNAGTANPYPSTIEISGLSGQIDYVTVTLLGLTHSFPADLDVLLVGPDGLAVVLMAGVGGEQDVAGINLTFEDGGRFPLSQLVSTIYQPTTNRDATLPPGAPAGPYESSLGAFFGHTPNGTWSLYVNDTADGDDGSLAGWRLTVVTLDAFTDTGGPGAVTDEQGRYTVAGLDPNRVYQLSIESAPGWAIVQPPNGSGLVDATGTPFLQTVDFDVFQFADNVPPTVNLIDPQTVSELSPLQVQVQAQGDPGETLTYTLDQAPAGAALDPITGLFTWTPDDRQGGRAYSVRVRVTDDGLPAAFVATSFTVTVLNAPDFDSVGGKTPAQLADTVFAAREDSLLRLPVVASLEGDEPADLNGDGQVTLADVNVIKGNYLAVLPAPIFSSNLSGGGLLPNAEESLTAEPALQPAPIILSAPADPSSAKPSASGDVPPVPSSPPDARLFAPTEAGADPSLYFSKHLRDGGNSLWVRREMKLLPAEAGLEHEALSRNGIDPDVAFVAGIDEDAFRGRDGSGLGAEFEVPALKGFQGRLAQKENHLRINLASQLGTDGDLRQGSLPGQLIVIEQLAAPVGRSDSGPSFGHMGKDGVAL
jgi:subtilisin-like proprotein convertase family protein